MDTLKKGYNDEQQPQSNMPLNSFSPVFEIISECSQMQFNGVNNKMCLCSLVVSDVGTLCACVRIPCACGLQCCVQEAFSSGVLQLLQCGSSSPRQFPSHPFSSFFPLFQQCDMYLFLLLLGGSWLGCQDLLAMGADFIYELAAKSGSSWMSQAPSCHFSNAVVK